MELDCENNCMELECNIESDPPSSPDINDIVGDPQMDPRLGDEYQVEIPSLITESERLQLIMNPADSEAANNKSLTFALGLPVPPIWIGNDGAVNVLEPAETIDVKPNITADNEKDLRPITFEDVMTDERKSCQQGQGKTCGSASGKLTNSWSDTDMKIFLLGLFIFGKNFIQMKRFLEEKKMGEILSFYYGKFYKSDEHVRWSDCRKIKGRKCMTGQKLFTGWRQHELLSRLISKVPEHVQDALLQVSKSYAKGRASLQEYIFSLKSTVGLGTLVEAVGIGRDKADLTRFTAEPPKSNPLFSIHPCAPTGKAWSSLEPCDILKYLTGGFRLSKAKSNDLFWEAVWPRLLARGWHSEQPNNNPGFVSSRDYLVFLIPGVKKFSRRKLVKGDQYFDSVSDVLNKVVSEPNLLELEFEEGKVRSCNEEDGWVSERASDKDDQSDSHRHSYLKPRVSSVKTDHMTFTVVDTSLKHGGKSSDLRELRPLPSGFKITSQQTDQLRRKESDSHGNAGAGIVVKANGKADKGDKHSNEADHTNDTFDSISQKLTKFTVVDTSLVHCGKLSRELRCVPTEMKVVSKKRTSVSREIDGSLSSSSPDKKETINCHRNTSDGESINRKGACNSINNNSHKLVERCQSQKTSMSDDRKLKKTVKQASQKARSGHSTHVVPPTKRRRLTACAKAETSRVLEISSEDMKSEKLGLSQRWSLAEDSKKTACSSDEVVEADNKGSFVNMLPKKIKGSIVNKDSLGTDMSCSKVEKCESQPQLDLFINQLPPKLESDEMMEEDDMEEDNKGSFVNLLPKKMKGSIVNKDCLGTGMSCSKVEKCEPQPQLNLIVHQLPPKRESDEMMEEDEKCLKPNDAGFTSVAQKQVQKPVEISGNSGSLEQKTDVNPRRQSTRNRPLTVRALESIENEFLCVQRTQKRKKLQTPKTMLNPCQTTRIRFKFKMHLHSSSGGSSAGSMQEKNLNGNSDANQNSNRSLH